MKCETAHNFISDYADGKIEPPMRVVLENHLSECAPCREELRGAQELSSLFQGLPTVDPPANFRASVLEQVAHQRRPARIWLNRLRPPVRQYRWSLAAVGAAAAVALLFTQSTQIGVLTNGITWKANLPVTEGPLRSEISSQPELIFSGTGSSVNPLQGPVKINLLIQPRSPMGRTKVLLEDLTPGLTCENQGVSSERGKVLWQGSANPDQSVTLPLTFRASQPAIHRALLLIEGEEQSYRRMILLPALTEAQTPATDVLRGEMSTTDALSQLARQFGIIVVTDLTRQRAVDTQIKLSLPGHAMAQLAARRNLQWKVSNGVYNIYDVK